MSTENTAAKTPEQPTTKRGPQRTLVGRVTSAKMQKTVVVEVSRQVRHPLYGKFIRLRKKVKAHDEQGQYRVGDLVELREHRPLSRDKRWLAVRLVARSEVIEEGRR